MKTIGIQKWENINIDKNYFSELQKEIMFFEGTFLVPTVHLCTCEH